MKPVKQAANAAGVTEVAQNMADAITYLSRVAHDSGLESISVDLTLIQQRLQLMMKLIAMRKISENRPRHGLINRKR